MPSPPISPIMLSEQIKEFLLDQIIKGEIQPGERLVESRIASQMHTSQAPVRDAIRELGMVGLIEIRRNKGAVVRAFDRDELVQIYAVRAELEGMAVELAAFQNGRSVGAEMLDLCRKMETATNAGNLAKFVRLNSAFHRCIVLASGNGPLLEIWDRLDIQSRTAMNVTRSKNDFDAIHSEHRAIADAVAKGDGVAARQVLATHVRRVAC